MAGHQWETSGATVAQRFAFLSGAGLVLIFVIALCRFVFNAFFHPLSRFPGPKLWAGSYAPRQYYELLGLVDFKIREMHERYGHVVRIGPDALSYSDARAWKDIHGYGAHNLEKDQGHISQGAKEPGLIQAAGPDHARMRKQLTHAFSEKALREQEPLVSSYVDTLIDRLREIASSGSRTDILIDYTYTTIDITSKLSFGQSFDVLRDPKYRPWIEIQSEMGMIFTALKFKAMYPIFAPIVKLFASKRVINGMVDNRAYVSQVMSERLAAGAQEDRRDFWSYVLKNKDQENGMTDSEMSETARNFIFAGSDTTKLLLSATTFYLLKNPEWLRKVTEEVRSAFATEDNITFKSASSEVPLMLACVEEVLRLHPPVASIAGSRRTPSHKPMTIVGEELPPDTSVCVHMLSTFRSSANFHDPLSFRPERWLPPAEEHKSPFKNDNKAALQPFSYGPRGCIGKNLAYSKMRIILARVLWNFDLTLCEESSDWDKHKIWTFWKETPLWVTLKEVKH